MSEGCAHSGYSIYLFIQNVYNNPSHLSFYHLKSWNHDCDDMRKLAPGTIQYKSQVNLLLCKTR